MTFKIGWKITQSFFEIPNLVWINCKHGNTEQDSKFIPIWHITVNTILETVAFVLLRYLYIINSIAVKAKDQICHFAWRQYFQCVETHSKNINIYYSKK